MAKKMIPPDPENMNNRRANWAANALDAFRDDVGGDAEDAIADLLCDLMHYCDRSRFDFAAELKRARRHYKEETHG